MPSAEPHPLHVARRRLGLSQADVAAAAGVSRSQVSAIEQGRHVPAVDAALRLAAAVGASVEELFAAAQPQPAPAAVGVLGALPDGAPVRTARVGDRLVADPTGPGPAAWASADATMRAGRVEPLPGGRADGCVLVGCDPALAAIERLSAGRGSARVVSVAAPTGDALRALAAGRCHGVLVHGRAGRLPAAPVPVRRWRFARWEVGVAYDRGRDGARSLASLLAGDQPLVRRAASAASDEAVVRAARRLGVRTPRRDVVAAGHLEAAQRTAWTGAPAVTYRPAASAFGLGFAPVEEHVVELWVAEPWQAHPGAEAALEIIGSRAYRARLAQQDGYDLEGAGAAVAA